MAFSLSSPHLHFSLDPSASTWSLFTQTTETPSIEGARLNGYFRFSDRNLTHLGGLRPWQWRGWLDDADFSTREEPQSPHGPLHTLSARVRSGHDSLAITAEFSMPQQHPFLIIRLRVRNVGREPLRVARLHPLFVGPLHRTGGLRLAGHKTRLTFFSNGWQSWSFSGTLTANRLQPATWLTPIQGPVVHNPHTPLADFKNQFSSDMFAVLAAPEARSAIVAGFLAQREQFGSVDAVLKPDEPSLRLRAQGDDVELPPGAELATDPAFVQLLAHTDLDPLQVYTHAVAREHALDLAHDGYMAGGRPPVGWCSWYQYFNRVTEADLHAHIERIAADRQQLPIDLVQLDDGFQANVGDWFETNARFPSGLRALSDRIRSRGLAPGLWLAPFIARPDSALARQHPDWFIRNRAGLPANAGYVFNTFARGLDLTHPAAQEHTRRLIATAVHEWGYDYLKLDFLYAAALSGRRREATRTRAQVMRQGLQLIREAAGPNAFLLACGCPLGSAVGLADAMRIGPDVDVRWRPKYGVSAPFRDEPGMPSARNAIRNTLARAPLHNRWWINDPDCLLVREGTELSYNEVIALATVIALSGGLLVLSDDLTSLTPERRKLIEPLLPVLGAAARAHDWLEREMPETLELPLRGPTGAWKVFGIFNWTGRPADRTLPIAADSHVLEFWTQVYQRAAGPVTLPKLPPHSARLLAVRPVETTAQYIGSSLHFSQGYEVSAWQVDGRQARLGLALGRAAEGALTLGLPLEAGAPLLRLSNGSTAPGARLADGIYRFAVALENRAELTLEW